MLRSLSVEEVNVLRREPVEQETLEKTEVIVRAVRDQGVEALRHYAETFGDIEVGGALTYPRDVLDEALSSLPEADRALLERCAERVRVFAQAQRDSIQEMELPIPGGRAGHRVIPMDRAGCYAPGGRFPLPSSVIMTSGSGHRHPISSSIRLALAAGPCAVSHVATPACLSQASRMSSVTPRSQHARAHAYTGAARMACNGSAFAMANRMVRLRECVFPATTMLTSFLARCLLTHGAARHFMPLR